MHFNLKTFLLPLVVVLGLLAGLLLYQGWSPATQVAPTPTLSVDDLAQSAAINGARAFFSIDEKAGKQAWIETFCKVSTESGCAFYRLGLDKLWQQFMVTYSFTTPTILDSQMVPRPGIEANQHVWKLAIQLEDATLGSTPKQDEAYALVVLEDDAWKFDRFLTPAEIGGLDRDSR